MNNFLERLYELRKLDICDPEVRDVLSDFQPYYKSGLQSLGIRVDIFRGCKSFIMNINYTCSLYIYDNLLINLDDIVYDPPIEIYKYYLSEINTLLRKEQNSVTVEEMFFPDIKPLFDVMFDNNFMIDKISYMSYHYARVFMNYEFENNFVKICLLCPDIIHFYGYIVSNNFIIMIYYDRYINMVVLNYNEQLLVEIIGLDTSDKYKKFIFKHKSEIFDEQITFRQFLGISNVKSAYK